MEPELLSFLTHDIGVKRESVSLIKHNKQTLTTLILYRAVISIKSDLFIAFV